MWVRNKLVLRAVGNRPDRFDVAKLLELAPDLVIVDGLIGGGIPESDYEIPLQLLQGRSPFNVADE